MKNRTIAEIVARHLGIDDLTASKFSFRRSQKKNLMCFLPNSSSQPDLVLSCKDGTVIAKSRRLMKKISHDMQYDESALHQELVECGCFSSEIVPDVKKQPIKKPPIILDEEKFEQVNKACSDITAIPKVKPAMLDIVESISLSFENGEIYLHAKTRSNHLYEIPEEPRKVQRKATLRGCIGAVGDAINDLPVNVVPEGKQKILHRALELVHLKYRELHPDGMFASDTAISSFNKNAVRQALKIGEWDNEYERLCVVTGLEEIHQESGYWPDIYDISFVRSRIKDEVSCRLYYDIYVV